ERPDDVGMVECPRGVVLLFEAFEVNRIGRDVRGHYLDGDRLASLAVASLVDRAHAPLGNLFYKVVIADGLHVAPQLVHGHARPSAARRNPTRRGLGDCSEPLYSGLRRGGCQKKAKIRTSEGGKSEIRMSKSETNPNYRNSKRR